MPHGTDVPIEARVATPILTRTDLFDRTIQWLDEHPDRRFSVFRYLEGIKPSKLRRKTVAGTSLQPLCIVLQENGIDVGPTIGDLLTAAPYLTVADLHDAVCECLGGMGACATSTSIARRMRGMTQR